MPSGSPEGGVSAVAKPPIPRAGADLHHLPNHLPNFPRTQCGSEFESRFADATVERVVFEGNHATAEFSNNESVEFEGQKPDGGDNFEHWAWFITERWIKNAGRR